MNVLRFFFLIVVLFSTGSSLFGQLSANLLTSKTKGYLCIPNVDEFQARWEQTQLGKLTNDPVMEPFTQDVREQIRQRLFESNLNVAINWEDVRNVCKRELCIAAVIPDDGEGYASVLIMDVAGRDAQARELIDRVSADLLKRGAEKKVASISGNEFVVHELPREKGQLDPDRVVRFIVDNIMIIGNHEEVCKSLAIRLAEKEFSDSLSETTEFKRTVTLCDKRDENVKSQIHWFVEPFGFVKLVRRAARETRARGRDMLAVFKSQGFDAIKGVGGVTAIKTKDQEFLHRAFIYAPEIEGADPGQKYKLAARMLDFPNGENWSLPGWIPSSVATYAHFRWKTREAFDFSATLVDAVLDSEIFDQVLIDLATDPNGPKVDIRKGLVDHLGQDILILTDQVLPVTVNSERAAIAISITNAKAVELTLHKLFDDDPTAKVTTIEGRTVWELKQEDTDEQLPVISVLTPHDPVVEPAAVKEDEVVLTDYTITVAHDHLLVSSHLSLIADLLKKRDPIDALAASKDYALVQEQLEQIGAGADSCRFFARTDREYQTNFELIREGKMPESKTMLGKILNRILSDPKREVVRQQQLNAKNLPPFETVRQSLGPAGLFSRSRQGGWEIGGLLLEKQKAEDGAEPESPEKKAIGPVPTAVKTVPGGAAVLK